MPNNIQRLCIAARDNNINRLVLLLTNDSSLAQQTTKDGYTALHYACKHNSQDAILALIASGGDIFKPSDNAKKVTPFSYLKDEAFRSFIAGESEMNTEGEAEPGNPSITSPRLS